MTHFIFDCDDVLLDWQTGFLAFLNDHGIWPDTDGPQTWDLHHWIGGRPEDSRYLVQKFNASQAFGSLRACPHARDVIWSLRDAGHTISVLTACGDSTAVKQMRAKNLVREFDSVTLDDDPWTAFDRADFLPLGASKFTALYDASMSHIHEDEGRLVDLVFIEDSFKHAQSGVANGIKSYCLRRSHNRRDEAENPDSGVIWIDDLRHILP